MEKEKRIHPVTRVSVESSNIHSVGHCPDCDGIYIAFKKGDGFGTLYHYPKAGKELFDKLSAAESKGKFFAANMRKLAAKQLADYDG